MNGSSTIIMTATDIIGLTSSAIFEVIVSPVNDTPQISVIGNQEIYLNTSIRGMSIAVTDVETAVCDMDITFSSSNSSLMAQQNISYTCDTDGFYLSFTPTENQTGQTTISLTITDAQGLYDSESFMINVNNPGSWMALDFDGIDDNVSLPAFNLNSNNVSISAWIKLHDTQNNNAAVVFSRKGTTLSGIHIINGNELGYEWNNEYWLWESNLIIPLNTWVHVALTIEPDKGTLYLNGVPSVNNNVHAVEAFDAETHIGRDRFNEARYFNGQIDEVRIWNVSRSETQIRETMCKRLTGNETGLVAYYRFDHTSGTTLLDLSGNGYNGTLVNMDDSDWITSGAAIGDISIFDYDGTIASDFTAILYHEDGDYFRATGFSGTVDGIQLYAINHHPTVINPYSGYVIDNHYWGVFPIGSNATYSIYYDYKTDTTVLSNDGLDLMNRANNADLTWTAGQASFFSAQQTLAQSNISGTAATEFCLMVNQFPQIGATSDLTVLTQTVIQPIHLTVADAETSACNLSVNVTSSNTSLVSSSHISYTCGAEGFYISLTLTDGQSGSSTISVSVEDDGNRMATTSFAITKVNEPPVIAQVMDQFTNEDTALSAFKITATDNETSGCQLGITYTSSNTTLIAAENISYTCDTGIFYFSFAPTLNQHGSSTISMMITDAGNLTTATSFGLNVNAINDPPVNTVIPSLSGVFHEGQILSLDKGTWHDNNDLIPGDLSFSFKWERADDNTGTNLVSFFNISGQSYTVTHEDNRKYIRAIVTARDNGESSPSQTTTKYSNWYFIDNAAPLFSESSPVSITMDEDAYPQAFALTLHATDIDADILSWQIDSQASHGQASVSGTGFQKDISYTPTLNYNGSDSFVVLINDG
ncbi:MAG: hypothetical protein HQK75_14320, partial [Candidatus Magnetomorum sp.]|nr:hypothetical protein [Candidatus Magnetomorum sp.]